METGTEQIEEVVDPVEVVDDVEVETEVDEPVVNNEAQRLFDLLNNPATAAQTLKLVANSLGLSVQETKTPEAQVAIRDVIKQALGDDLAFLGDKLGPLGDALEGIINARISKAEQNQAERFREQEAVRFTSLVDSSMKKLSTETKGEFDNYLPKINKLMEEIPLGKQTPDQYLRRLYNLAKTESSDNVPSKDKLENSRRQASKNNLSQPANPERVLNGSSKNPSYREAIMAAAKGVTF